MLNLPHYRALLGGAFTPASLFTAGEQGVWYDPSDLTTMFQDAAGTTPVSAVNDPVGKILDKSGNGNHATQSTTTSRPLLKQDANGRFYLSFDGVDDYLDFTALAISNQTICFGFAPTSSITAATSTQTITANKTGDGSFILLGSATGTITNERVSWLRSLTGGYINGGGETSEDFSATPYTMMFTFDTTPSTSYSRNGVTKTLTATSGAFGNGAFTATTYPTNYARLAATAGLTAYFAGSMYGFVIRGAASSRSQILALEAYMNGKTGAY